MLEKLFHPLKALYRLTSVFNEASRFNDPGGSFILADIGTDDPLRGDSRGREGLARAIAEKTGGRMEFTSDEKLRALYGADDRTPQDWLYRRFFEENGRPDIVLGERDPTRTALSSLSLPGFTRYYTSYNETLSLDYIKNNKGLVSHHLSPALLDEKGRAFREKHADITGSLIAVIAADGSFACDQVARKLALSCRHLDNPTVFICGGRRSYEMETALGRRLREELEMLEGGGPSSVDVRIWRFDRQDPGNPYLGLLATADHFLVAGDSRSIVSEVLATGKTAHLFQSDIDQYDPLAKTSYVRDFNDAAFRTEKQVPLNLTFDLADALIKDHQIQSHCASFCNK